ncbi:MAG: tetratricopeptide (TPR) repeat protein [Vicingaceae bacterium]|jgi:tetratricopeptide (TPR) repeat protein
MKKNTIKSFAFVGLAAVTTVACNPLKNMTKRASEVSYTVTPSPLEMHGDSVEINIAGTIPPKFFNKKVSVEITPTINYEGGDKSLDKILLAGETSEVDGQKINYEKGGSFTFTDKVAYVTGMDVATLNAAAVGKYKGKEKAFEPVQVATGTVITPMSAMDDDKAIVGADKFTKTTPMNSAAVINYEKNKSNVRSSELSDEDVKTMKTWAAKMAKNPMFIFKGADVTAYASPEGEISLNANLANQRANTGASSVNSILRTAKVKAASDKDFFMKNGKGEDWDGFKTAMQASDIKDKDLILRVLSMYEDNSKREQEIRNLAATFEVIQESILPNLRRSEVNLKGEMTSFSDEKIKNFSSSNPDTLSAEELLYAATMYTDMQKKMDIYVTFTKLFPNDWRGPNNVGYIQSMQNLMSEAKGNFDKANSLSPNSPVINNNLGVYERAMGNNDKAMEYYAAANGAGPEVGANMGYLQMWMGDYSSAVASYASTKSYNAALAQTLNGDYQTALQTIDGSSTASSAESLYLKAIIGARMGDKNMMVSSLKASVAANGEMKVKAKKDAEFTKYKDDSEFQAAVN